MINDLSKGDKRAAREIIAKGIESDLEKALNDTYTILEEWKGKTISNREAYQKLYKYIREYDKEVSRYDDRNSTLLFAVAYQLRQGFISEADLEPLSDESKGWIKRLLSLNDE